MDKNLLGAAVLAHIRQSFLRDARQFAANRLGEQYLSVIHEKSGCNSSFTLEALHSVAQKNRELVPVDINRFHLLHQLAKLGYLFAKQHLYPLKFVAD